MILLLACVEDCAPVWLDADGDGWGDEAWSTDDCHALGSWAAEAGDCDDTDASVYPGAAEACDGRDGDCDGVAENVGWADADGDGWGSDVVACEGVSEPGDCDDGDAGVYPGGLDACGDAVDADCDGQDPSCDPTEGTLADASARVDGVGGWAVGAEDAGLLVGDGSKLYRFDPSLRGNLTSADAGLTVTENEDGDGFGSGVRWLDDVDGDGVPEVLAVAPGSSGRPTRLGGAWILSGALVGTVHASVAMAAVRAADDEDELQPAAAIGDITGDGAGDLTLSSAYGVATYAGHFLGERGLDDWDDRLIGTDDVERLADAGDVDGDGLADLVLHGSSNASSVQAWVVTAPLDGRALAEADAAWTAERSPYSCASEGVGDLDGDGRADVVVCGRDFAWVVFEPLSGGDLSGAGATLEPFYSAFAGGDVDGDGARDLVASAHAYGDGGTGLVAVFAGGELTGALGKDDAFARIWGDAPSVSAGYALESGFDADDDGRDDLWIGAPGASATFLVLAAEMPDE